MCPMLLRFPRTGTRAGARCLLLQNFGGPMRLVAAALSLLLAAPAFAAEATKEKKRIDLVLALDTSNSMDGLIGSAKARLWDVVNELARAKPMPELRVALLTYGNDSYSAQD